MATGKIATGAETVTVADPASEARRLKGLGRLDEALAFNFQAVARDPASGVAEHNLASTLGDISRFVEAEAAARRAFAKGLDAPETHLVHARALQGLLRLDEAEQAFGQALARRPAYLDAHRDLAQLRWMRSGDAGYACALIDQVLTQGQAGAAFIVLRARIEQAAGHGRDAARRLVEAARILPQDAALLVAAAQSHGSIGEPEAQMHYAAEALRLVPGSGEAACAAVEAMLALGRATEAAALAKRIVANRPGDQGARALLYTAWRLLSDPRAAVCEDPALVRSLPIATPPGWPSLADYLADLAKALRARHAWHSHPIDLSLRHGSQTQEDLSRSEDPAIRALFAAVAPPIARYLDELGPGSDPTREQARQAEARSGGQVLPRIVGAWSVLLRPGGYHVDHVHPQGWLSSAFHVEMPDGLDADYAGWLAIGRPGVPTRPALPPLRHVRPVPGNLVLFPSWMWHGTEPFGGERPRLTVAFDIVPS